MQSSNLYRYNSEEVYTPLNEVKIPLSVLVTFAEDIERITQSLCKNIAMVTASA